MRPEENICPKCEKYWRKCKKTPLNGTSYCNDFVENITAAHLKETTRIQGVLVLFLFSVALYATAGLILYILTFKANFTGTFFAYNNSFLLVHRTLTFGLAFYTIWAFIQRDPYAVSVAKIFIVLVFISSLFALPEEDGRWLFEWDPDLLDTRDINIGTIVWCIASYLYLRYSKQVKEICPKSYRRGGLCLVNLMVYILFLFYLWIVVIPFAIFFCKEVCKAIFTAIWGGGDV